MSSNSNQEMRLVDKIDENELHNTKEKVSSKWVVTGSSDYESFEFNECGNYIIIKNPPTSPNENQEIIFGTYHIKDIFTLELSNFWTLKIYTIDDNEILTAICA